MIDNAKGDRTALSQIHTLTHVQLIAATLEALQSAKTAMAICERYKSNKNPSLSTRQRDVLERWLKASGRRDLWEPGERDDPEDYGLCPDGDYDLG